MQRRIRKFKLESLNDRQLDRIERRIDWYLFCQKIQLPWPVLFGLRAGIFFAAILGALPYRLISIPIAIGGGISIALLYQL